MRRQSWFVIVMAFVGGLCGGILASLWMPEGPATAREPESPHPAIVAAQEFRLVNPEGETRARLHLLGENQPVLSLSDANCDERAWFGVFPKGQSGLVLTDPTCQRRIAVDVFPDGLPSVTVRDQFDMPRIWLHLLADGKPVVELYDQNGERIWSVPRSTP